MTEDLRRPPRAFISYTWDDKQHKDWVRDLATSLREDGVDVTLDQWHLQPGDQLPAFMDKAIRENDFVLIICTPKYKARSEGRNGGAGYEGDVIQGEVFVVGNHRKFIPILRTGDWKDAAPSQLLGKVYIPLKDTLAGSTEYDSLLKVLHSQVLPPPPIGSLPDFEARLHAHQGVRTLAGHTKSVSDVKVTPDGSLAVSVSRDGTLRVWDLNAGREVRIIQVKRSDDRLEDLSCVALTADGSRALSQSATSLKLWDLEDGKLVYEIYENFAERRYTCAVAMTPDGKLGLFHNGPSLTVWDLECRRRRYHLPTPGGVDAVAVSANGLLCLSGSGWNSTKRLKVWNLDAGLEARVLDGNGNSVYAVDITPSGELGVSLSSNMLLQLWHISTGRELRTIRTHASYSWFEARDVAISGDGRVAVTAGTDDLVSVWDLGTGVKTHTLVGHRKTVTAVAITSNGGLVVSCSEDHTIKLWDL